MAFRKQRPFRTTPTLHLKEANMAQTAVILPTCVGDAGRFVLGELRAVDGDYVIAELD
jgi:hypothetical protein